ncbi:FxsA family protein [Pseudovibrio sp. SPO723]|uniref:FxsA family protein n=1 Tax=Nesiotobacter zosterae TaxID=392721 RepID=UPI0029C46113|nr:FxsA family protein [Pseudovibrio sp. SPO723]MDX5595084.1 FxsA family protein [Pseudovibrio sp. SPO723]
MPVGLIILAAFILVPTVEIFLFVEVGSVIGAIPTILLTILTAVTGTALLRHQGLSLLMRMRSEMDAGRMPGDEMVHGAFIVLAGICLLIPGFFTDAIGLLLFIPAVRTYLGRALASRVQVDGNVHMHRHYRTEDGVVDLDADEWSSHKPGDSRGPSQSGPRTIEHDSDTPWKPEDRN